MPPKRRNDGPNKRERMARQYGFVLSFFDADPDLKRLFNQAVKSTWTPERFVAELRDTKWFKKNAASVRNAVLQKAADPATYKQEVSRVGSLIRDMWGERFGGTLGTLDEGELRQWAQTAYTMGWSEDQIIDNMTKGIKYQKLLKHKRLGGTAAELKTKIEALGRAYGLNPGNKFIASQVSRVIEGRDTFEGVAARLKDWSKREYKAFAAELEGGQTIEDIAQPYIAKMADILELNPEAIHARQGLIQKALRYQNAQGDNVSMSFTDFENMLRQDSRWQYTNNAREQAVGVTQNLLKSFGLVS